MEFWREGQHKASANYISEVWYNDVRTQKYKYRNLWFMQGVLAHPCGKKSKTISRSILGALVEELG